jgi:hypothetical protein
MNRVMRPATQSGDLRMFMRCKKSVWFASEKLVIRSSRSSSLRPAGPRFPLTAFLITWIISASALLIASNNVSKKTRIHVSLLNPR